MVAYDFVGPLFGLGAAPDGSLLVADAGAGIVELSKGVGSLVVDLPGVTDVAPIGRGSMFAVTGAGDWKLWRVSRGHTGELADLLEFETDVDPDGGAIDSNPFDVEPLTGGQALVADAGRIEPGTLHAQCGISPACTPNLDDELTSIVDLSFGPDGTLYATEIDEGSFLAVEIAVFFGTGLGVLQGGTVNACDVSTGDCVEVAPDLTIPIATAVDREAQVFVATDALLPSAQVIALP